MSSSSADAFVRLIQSKHQDVQKKIENFYIAITSEDLNSKEIAASEAKNAVHTLLSLLTDPDKPAWLNQLSQRLEVFSREFPHGSYNFLNRSASATEAMKSHTWFSNPKDAKLDFDSIFIKYKEESRLEELFEEITAVLQSILDSGEIDSSSMQRALERMISTLKGCESGSYFYINSAWDFLLNFLKNYMWEELSKIPALGSAITALRKTLDDTNEEMFKLHNNIKVELEHTAESEIRSLKGKASFSFPTYNSTGAITLNSDNSKLIEQA